MVKTEGLPTSESSSPEVADQQAEVATTTVYPSTILSLYSELSFKTSRNILDSGR
jgi:hypothetical protein